MLWKCTQKNKQWVAKKERNNMYMYESVTVEEYAAVYKQG